MPMIVTDIAGREPMVILPFEAYEQLSERGSLPTAVRLPRPVEVLRSEPTITQEPEPVSPVQEGVARTSSSTGVPVRTETVEGSEMSLEERFYIEPVEEDEKRLR